MLFSILAILISCVCIIPFVIAFLYFRLGIQILVSGKKEKNRTKTISGFNTVFSSMFLMFMIYLFWFLMFSNLVSVEA